LGWLNDVPIEISEGEGRVHSAKNGAGDSFLHSLITVFNLILVPLKVSVLE
tara:strand:+ start:11648 stop:11800 length:153 start_codon:yes stop_codon:yes gene_type:complete